MEPDTIDQSTRKLSNVSGETEDELQEGGKRLPAKLLVSVTSVPLLEINGDSFADETDDSQTRDKRGERLIHCQQNRQCF